MPRPKSSLWWRDSNQTASGKTGAVHAAALFAAATARLEEAHDAATVGQRSGLPAAAGRGSAEAVTKKCAEARILVEAAIVVRGRGHEQG